MNQSSKDSSISKLVNFLYKPHPFIFNSSSLTIPFVVTFLLIIGFQPFEFSEFTRGRLLLLAGIFGVGVSCCIWAAVRGLQWLFPGLMEPEYWTVGKEIGLIFTVLGSIVLLVGMLTYIFRPELSIAYLFMHVALRTLFISFFPVVILVLYEQYHHQKQKLKEAVSLNQQLSKQKEQGVETTPSEKVALPSEGQNVLLRINIQDLLYAKSDGNYVEIYYMDGNEPTKELLRTSLKVLENQLDSHNVFRCHKQYMVNLERIQKVAGNARNLELTIENTNQIIPVSRTKVQPLKQRLNNLLV